MKKINRKEFISKSGMGLGAALLLSKLPASLSAQSFSAFKDMPIGFQTFPIREILSKDFAGTLKMMAGLGYKVVEMCSPKGYEKIGFGPLMAMKTADMKNIITDAGLSCPSCHFGFGEITDKTEESIEFSRELGLNHMICSTFWLPDTATIKDYQDAADKLNIAAGKIKKAGMQAGFHNHEMEFAKLEGQLIYDALLSRFDPDLVKMQFQTEVIKLGYKGPDYFKKFPGRFISAHLSDWTADKKQAAIGKGVIDWKEFFATAKKAGVEHYFVEMDFDKFKDSASYLRRF